MRKFKLIIITLIVGAFTFLAFGNVKASSMWIEDPDGYYYYNLETLNSDGSYQSINVNDYDTLQFHTGYNWGNLPNDFYSSVTLWISTEEKNYILNLRLFAGHLFDDYSFEYVSLEELRAAKVLRNKDIQSNPDESYITEPPVNEVGMWHQKIENRTYINIRYIAADDSVIQTSNTLEYYTDFTKPINDEAFSNQTSMLSINNPDPTEYEKLFIEYYAVPAGGYEATLERIELDNNINKIELELLVIGQVNDGTNTITLYGFKIHVDNVTKLLIYPGGTMYDNPDTPYLDVGQIHLRMYYESYSVEEPIDPSDPETNVWESLPTTTGSPKNPSGDWGYVNDLVFNNVNKTISFKVTYKGNIYPVLPFTLEGNTEFLSKVKKTLYYTDFDTGDRILYMSFGEDESNLLLYNTNLSDVTVWKGEALWNLTKNDVQVTDTLLVYSYIAEIKNNEVYSYFYMPDVPIDNLISVTTNYSYTNWSNPIFGSPKAGPIKTVTTTVVQNESSYADRLWVANTYKGAYISGAALTTILTAATIFGAKVPVYGWAISAGAFVIGGILQIADSNDFFVKEISQIQHVIPDQRLTSEINQYIASKNGTSFFDPKDDKLYRLYLGQTEGKNVQVIDNSFQTTQIVWETNGQMYVANEGNITQIPPGGPGTEPPSNITPDNTNWVELIVGAVVVIGWVMVLNANQGFKKIENFIRITLIYGAVILAIFLIYKFVIVSELFVLRL